MKIVYKLSLTTLLLILLFSSCNSGVEDCHNTIMLKNNSGQTIYYASTLKEGFLNYNPTSPAHAADYKILAGESKKVKIGITLSCWEQVMENADGYVCLYIYDATTLETTSWESAKDNPLKEYKLTTSQLSKMKWEVKYP